MHQPTERVIRVLRAVSESKNGCRLSELSGNLGIPKGTLSPILETLAENGLLVRRGDFYLVGVALLAMSRNSLSGQGVAENVHLALERLAEMTGETCYFGVFDNGMVLYLDKADSAKPLRMLVAAKRRLPAYATGVGKALLMDKSIDELRGIYPNGLPPLTKNTVADIESLYAQLEDARASGYASEIEESTEYIRCFAVPIYRDGKIAAAISVAIPVFRYNVEDKQRILRELFCVADAIGVIVESAQEPFVNMF